MSFSLDILKLKVVVRWVSEGNPRRKKRELENSGFLIYNFNFQPLTNMQTVRKLMVDVCLWTLNEPERSKGGYLEAWVSFRLF